MKNNNIKNIMSNKTIFITGTSSGLGKSSAIYFAQNGWNVAATMRSPEKEKELIYYENIKLFKLDVTNPHEVTDAVNDAIDTFGKIDVVLNNAGVGTYGALELIDRTDINKALDVNVRGVTNVIMEFLPHFRQNSNGMFINISSVMGRSAALPLGSVYNMTKFALEGLIEGLYVELKPFNIDLRLVEPGGFYSEFVNNTSFAKGGTITAYDKITKIVEQQMMESTRKADTKKRDVIVKAIFKIATGRNKKFRTIVGNDAKTILTLRKILPIRMFLSFLVQSFKINK
ncbi:SDR family oxidoreductase [Dysgonomonas sp. Marseille-Q5470]|uniref:SDR family oxidoreductase n=1 Tax=Dysgonomonas sp. Marseille-Q5470 TaxID=3039494 RepID=UPI0024BCB015|nr:SDR family oxidoreductase [Dysgonomonas sp. Marseille-Q5470]